MDKQLIEALLTSKPYFGPAMRAMQGPAVRHRYLGTLVQIQSRLKMKGSLRVLEIGSWAGASAITWATAIQNSGREGRVTCVDPWEPYFSETLETGAHYRAMNAAAKDKKVFHLFLHNIRAAKVAHLIDYFVGGAHDVLPKFSSASFDIVYIDGCHDCDSVRADIREAKRLVREGGVICGDDLELQRADVDEGEHRIAVDSRSDFVYATRKGGFYHPGVTEAVADEFGPVSCWDGVWATRKVGQAWAGVRIDVSLAQIPAHIANAFQPDEINEMDQTRDYWIFSTGQRFFAMAKSLGPPTLLTERLRDGQLPPLVFSGDSLEDVRKDALVSEQGHASESEVRLIEETEQYNIVKAEDCILAVAKKLGPVVLFNERIGERQLAPVLLRGSSLEELRSQVVEEERRAKPPDCAMVGETTAYNLVRMGERFAAVAKQLGTMDLLVERVGERELAPLLLLGENLEEIRQKAFQREDEMIAPDVELVDEVSGYNIVHAGDCFLAVAKELGPRNLFREKLGERELPPLLLIDTDPIALRKKIEQLTGTAAPLQDNS